MMTRKRAKIAQLAGTAVGPFSRLPDCLLSLVFGYVSWRRKLAVLNLVSHNWRRIRAAWTSLSFASDEDDIDIKTEAHLGRIIAQAQTSALRALTTHIRDMAWLGVLIEPAVNLELLTLNQELVPSICSELVRILQTRASAGTMPRKSAKPLVLSVSLLGHSNRDFKTFAQLLSMVTVQRLQLREFDGTLSLWSKALGSSLQQLRVHVSQMGLTCLEFVEHLPGLRALDLSFCTKIQDEHLLALPRFVPHLEKLELCSCDKITDTAVATALVDLKDLTHLNLRRTRVTEHSIDHLTRDNVSLRNLNFHGTELRVKTIDWWSRLTQIVSLSLGACDLADAGLACLQGLVGLHHLDLRANFTLDGSGFVYLTGLPLRSLDLSECFGLRAFDQLRIPSLRVLSLERIRLMTFIKKNGRFSLCLQGVRGLEELSLAATHTRNTYLSQFLVLTKLKKLNLRSCCYLTDAAFATLAKFRCLTQICVEGTLLTEHKKLRAEYEFFLDKKN